MDRSSCAAIEIIYENEIVIFQQSDLKAVAAVPSGDPGQRRFPAAFKQVNAQGRGSVFHAVRFHRDLGTGAGVFLHLQVHKTHFQEKFRTAVDHVVEAGRVIFYAGAGTLPTRRKTVPGEIQGRKRNDGRKR
jgi:hypothetical protein